MRRLQFRRAQFGDRGSTSARLRNYAFYGILATSLAFAEAAESQARPTATLVEPPPPGWNPYIDTYSEPLPPGAGLPIYPDLEALLAIPSDDSAKKTLELAKQATSSAREVWRFIEDFNREDPHLNITGFSIGLQGISPSVEFSFELKEKIEIERLSAMPTLAIAK